MDVKCIQYTSNTPHPQHPCQHHPSLAHLLLELGLGNPSLRQLLPLPPRRQAALRGHLYKKAQVGLPLLQHVCMANRKPVGWAHEGVEGACSHRVQAGLARFWCKMQYLRQAGTHGASQAPKAAK